MKHPKLQPSGASAQSANTPEALGTLCSAWVDVRDLAKAHVRAIQRPEATGRIILSAGAFKWHDFLNAARSLQPPVYPLSKYADPNPDYDQTKTIHLLDFDVSKAEHVLDIHLHKEGTDGYISMEKLSRDVLEDFKSRGW
ncbi:hypothetical protein PHLCEN_2v5187 [Hermanssonia centrifuga]|uniref:Uncharacterized protein n=1 Tax=Hermanssonia centrifuga TaxID=98765 RepID=A0A2R6P8T5_9APHY|nr:hypothetical protein PHLCEN_2v5187 [Hermanssonia centrifuga]